MKSIGVIGWRAARPRLGAVRRSVRRRWSAAHPSGPPVAGPRPEEANGASADFYTALTLRSIGCAERAADLMERSCRRDPRFVRRWRRLGATALAAGRFDLAREATAHAIDLAPGDQQTAILHLALLDDSIPPTTDLRAIREAAMIRAMSVADGGDATALFHAGLYADSVGDAETALDRMRRATDIDPVAPSRLRAAAAVEERHGDPSRAGDLLRRAVELEDGDAPQSPTDTSDTSLDWAPVLALSLAAVDDPKATIAQLSTLAAAARRLGESEVAIRALGRIVAVRPTDATLFDQLGESFEALGRADDEVAARERATVLRPTAARFQRLALALTRARRHDEALVAHRSASRIAGSTPKWINQFGRTRRAAGEDAAAALLFSEAVERFPDHADLRFQLGFQCERLGDDRAAIEHYERALSLEPGRAGWWFRLGFVLERAGALRTEVVPRVGLVLREAGVLTASESAYERSLRLAPDDVRTLLRLGGVLERLGRFDDADQAYRRVTELAPDDPNGWIRLGRSVSSAANERGIYHGDEYDLLERVWGRAIELTPRHASVRNQLTRSSIKAGRWGQASDVAWFPAPTSTPSWHDTLRRVMVADDDLDDDTLDQAGAILARPVDELLSVPTEWWFSLHWRLLAANRFTDAYRAKRAMAADLVSRQHGSLTGDPAGLMERARALLFLDRAEEALEAVTPGLTASLDATLRRQLERHQADLLLGLGDLGPHLDALSVHAGAALPGSEERFQTMIEGRSVAIVGPALTDLPHGDEIDRHDVVIRTKFVADQLDDYALHAGSRTDVSYYALGSARFLRDEITEALTREELAMAVFRTSTYVDEPASIHRRGDLRYVPSEYQMSLRASQFAIQRIAYDVLRYRPMSVKVFNIDFFLSPDAYRPGYVRNYHDDHIKRGYVQVLGSFGHDYLADFKFTRQLHGHGLIQVDDNIARILQIAPDDYLARLDRRTPPGTSTGR